jgi:sirohydrochlorin ferrochelatase
MPPIAVILVDHGSRQPEAAAALAQVAQMAAQRLGLPVETAHLEIGQPTLDEAIDRTIAGGVSQIIVCPYFLAAGRHSQVDIPHVLSAARERHAGVKIQLAEPLGADALLAELIARRIRPLLPDGKSV